MRPCTGSGSQQALNRCLPHAREGGRQLGSRRAAGNSGLECFFQGQPVAFNEDAFLAQKPGAPLQAFHRRAVHLQLFKQVLQGPEDRAGTRVAGLRRAEARVL